MPQMCVQENRGADEKLDCPPGIDSTEASFPARLWSIGSLRIARRQNKKVAQTLLTETTRKTQQPFR